ncbi:YggS family pyridoxal phosphate-dependent enzyme [Rhodovibrio salinarum]|uniref:Pyridoxal phosphate homeostasis protein n=1 Tax=Rhodovibrio salinarum TaxID=1087 RepID=A0A934UZY7_9PROT|nr:YggS family pyridoxal phosphate-dependent enzyme [Rhodovibrio salinarum]MBK1696899.1 YggS family pyridoxal phosphate-dependent enzyme [Rhodovibrio salinarum]
MSEVAARLAETRDKIAAAARGIGRDPADVSLIAVSKKQPDERVQAALNAGQRVFGENRVQEAQQRWTERRAALADLELHLVGALQSNKAKDAVELFDAIHSVDRESVAKALAKEIAKQGRRPQMFVQINTGEEPQKAGIAPGDADAFIAWCRDELDLPIVGAMCLPPAEEEPAPHFALLAKIAARNGLPKLSMGMSGDYETAVQLGATHVRVGSALFGARAG